MLTSFETALRRACDRAIARAHGGGLWYLQQGDHAVLCRIAPLTREIADEAGMPIERVRLRLQSLEAQGAVQSHRGTGVVRWWPKGYAAELLQKLSQPNVA